MSRFLQRRAARRHVDTTEGHLSSADPPVAIEELLSHAEWVRGLVRRLLGVGHDADVDDIVQATYVRALSSPPTAGAPVRGWLATVAKRLFWETHRKQVRRERRESEAPGGPRPLPSPDESAILAERQRTVVDAVLGLPEPYRHVLLLRYFHDFAHAEIAEQLSVPVGTVRSRVKRGLDMLEDDLRERLDDEPGGWKAALLPLALWPERAPPVAPAPAPAAPALRTASLVTAAVVLIAITGVVAASWWGDWAFETALTPTPEAVESATGAGRERPHVDHLAGKEPTEPARVEDGEDAATAGDSEAEPETARPTGTLDVVLDGAPSDLDFPATLRIQPFGSSDDPHETWPLPDAAVVSLDGPDAAFDLATVFGPEADVHDARVTLDHPDLLPVTVAAVPAGPGDPGVPAVLPVRRAAVVTGRVLAASGEPVEGARVLCGIDVPKRHLLDAVTTGSDGAYRLRLPPGEMVHVFAEAAGHEAAGRTLRAAGAGEASAVDISLGLGHELSGRIVVPAGESVEGRLVKATLAQWQEQAYYSRTDAVFVDGGRPYTRLASARTDAEGAFVLRGLSDAPYRVRVEPQAPAAAGSAVDVLGWRHAAPAGDVVLDLRFAALAFRVEDPHGPVVDAGVSTWSSDEGGICGTRTDGSGRAVLEIRPGFELRWTVAGRGGASRSGTFTTPAAGEIATVPVMLDAPPDATWSVRLELPDGTPVTRAAFAFEPLDAQPLVARPVFATSEDGLFELEGLRRGPQRVTIRTGGHWTDVRHGWLDIVHEVSLPDPGDPPTLVPPGKGGRLRIRLESSGKDGSTARLRVLRDGGSVPIRVVRRGPSGGLGTGFHVEAAEFNDVIPALAAGDYTLVFERHGLPDVRRKVTVVAGEVADVRISLEPR